MPPTLAGANLVVIGGSSGLGYAVAEGAIAEGARATIASSGAAKVEAAAARLGNQAAGVVADVADGASLEALFAAAGAGGPVDHLVFTAGDWSRRNPGPVAELDFDAAAAAPAVRFWGALRAIKHALPHLAEGASITLTSGLVAHRPMKGRGFASAFGGAVEHLVRGLAVDLAPIRVNGVCPGLIATEATANFPEEMARRFTQGQPIPRMGQPAEVAQAYLYLMRGAYTTGQVLFVDGGRLLT
ncbi:MAG TPA: SDR family oxidoreductase [Caulobacteraceae bacterium]|nr:SDR family oxidoreductase [Caulobacteraceae bacterium]